jgi:hypothetical protein
MDKFTTKVVSMGKYGCGMHYADGGELESREVV